MKNYKKLSEKITMKFNWFELINLRTALRTEIRNCIKLDNYLGVKFPYYTSDKEITEIYKNITKQIKKY